MPRLSALDPRVVAKELAMSLAPAAHHTQYSEYMCIRNHN